MLFIVFFLTINRSIQRGLYNYSSFNPSLIPNSLKPWNTWNPYFVHRKHLKSIFCQPVWLVPHCRGDGISAPFSVLLLRLFKLQAFCLQFLTSTTCMHVCKVIINVFNKLKLWVKCRWNDEIAYCIDKLSILLLTMWSHIINHHKYLYKIAYTIKNQVSYLAWSPWHDLQQLSPDRQTVIVIYYSDSTNRNHTDQSHHYILYWCS